MNIYRPFANSTFWGGQEDLQLHPEIDLSTFSSMTVCIGIICMNGEAVIMAADTQVAPPTLKYATESPDCKIAQLAPRSLLAAAGEPPNATLLEEFKRSLPMEGSIEEAAKAISRVCARRWRDRAGQASTEWLLGMDYETFIRESGAKRIEEKLVQRVLDQVNRVLGVSVFLLAGCDSTGCHLYAIAETEGWRCADSPGFGAIGIGADLAMPILFRKHLVRSWPLADAVYLAYEAKRTAENSPAVGKGTSLAVILPGQDVCLLGQDAIARLETIYNSKEPPSLTKSETESIQAFLPNVAKSS